MIRCKKNESDITLKDSKMRQNVVRLIDVRRQRGDWSRDDLTQLQQAAGTLRCPGCVLGTDSGVTDEGEPWFAVYHALSGDVVTHFARISGAYVVCAPFLKGSLQGAALPELIERFLERYRAMAGLGGHGSVKPLYTRRR